MNDTDTPINDPLYFIELLKDVQAELLKAGTIAIVEFPGILWIDTPSGFWNIGTANMNWGGDFYDCDDDSQPIRHFEISFSQHWTDARIIALAILSELQSDDVKVRQA